MQIRLTRKFCDVLNGFDLRPLTIGQLLDATNPVAAMLLAEGWAELVMVDRADDAGRSPRRKLAATTFAR